MKKILAIMMAGIMIVLLTSVYANAAEQPNAAPTGIVQRIPGPHKQLFQPMNINPELIRKSMQARSEYESLTRQIVAKKKKLYEENPTIKKLQVRMKELQKQIDQILESDKELARLHSKFKNMSPQLPSGPKKKLPSEKKR